MGGHREETLHELALGLGLEHQPVGSGEHPREDRKTECRFVVGRWMQDGRAFHPVDDPHGRVVEVRIEDERVDIGGHCRFHQLGQDRALQVDPPLCIAERRIRRGRQERGGERVERRIPPGAGWEADHRDTADRLFAGRVDVGPGDEVLRATGQHLDLPAVPCCEVFRQQSRGRLRAADDGRPVAGQDEGELHRIARRPSAVGLTPRTRPRAQ